MTSLRAAAGSALLAILLAAPSRAEEPYTLHGVLSLSGGGAFLGNQEERTLHAVEGLVNERGGIGGRKIHFAIQDDTTSPVVAVQLATDIIAQHVPIMLGPTLVASCSAVGPLFKNGPVQYCFAPGVYPPPGSFTFAASVSTYDLVRASLKYFRDRGWKRIGLIASTDATGQEGERIVNEVAALPENQGESVVERVHFNTTDLSVDAQMSRLNAANPQIIIAWCVGTPFATVLHGYANNGLTVPLVTNSGNLVRAQMQQYAAFAPKELYFAATRYLAYRPGEKSDDPVYRQQAIFYATLAKAGLSPDIPPSIAWDTAWLLIGALEKVGLGASATVLHDYLEKLHGYVGINGVFDFTTGNQRGLGLDSALLVRWDVAKASWDPVSEPGGAALH